MEEIDPPIQIDPSVWATYEAAHVQAEAAIRAADIGAEMAWSAAKLQAWVGGIAALLSFFSIIAIILVGRWAYNATIKAAETQTQLEKLKHNAQISAYALKQKSIVNNLIEKLRFDFFIVKEITDSYEKYGTINFGFGEEHIEEPNEWKDTNMEIQSLLGKNFVIALSDSKDKLENFNRAKNIFISRLLASNKNSITHGLNKNVNSDILIDDEFERKTSAEHYSLTFALEFYSESLSNFDNSLSKLYDSIPNEEIIAG